MSTIVGIDNGISGGLAGIHAGTGQLFGAIPMPVRAVGDKDEPDVDRIIAYVRAFLSPPEVAIEEPLKHAKSSQAIRSMALCFGLIVGGLEAAGIAVHRIQVNEWQREMLGRVPVGKTKIYALRKANLLWPDEKWLASARCRVPHDGMVDAALIARYHSLRK